MYVYAGLIIQQEITMRRITLQSLSSLSVQIFLWNVQVSERPYWTQNMFWVVLKISVWKFMFFNNGVTYYNDFVLV